jgi:hypothetical protein
MTKQDLVNVIGKLFVDEEFRREYFNNKEQALSNFSGLTPSEKDFLDTKEDDIRGFVNALDIKYKGENKRS